MGRGFLTLVLTMVTPGLACAHGLGASVRVEGARVLVEAFFDDDTPAAHARVRVLDGQKKQVAMAVTDERGTCRLARPSAGDYQVVIDAGAGHRAARSLVVMGTETLPTETVQQVPTPERADFVETPWLRLGIGLGVIAGGSLLILALVGVRRRWGQPGRPSPS